MNVDDILIRVIEELIRPYTPFTLNNAIKTLLEYTNRDADIERFIAFIKQYRGDPTVMVKYFIYDYMESVFGKDISNYVNATSLSLKTTPEAFTRFIINSRIDVEAHPIIISFLQKQGIPLDFLRRMKYDKLEGI